MTPEQAIFDPIIANIHKGSYKTNVLFIAAYLSHPYKSAHGYIYDWDEDCEAAGGRYYSLPKHIVQILQDGISSYVSHISIKIESIVFDSFSRTITTYFSASMGDLDIGSLLDL